VFVAALGQWRVAVRVRGDLVSLARDRPYQPGRALGHVADNEERTDCPTLGQEVENPLGHRDVARLAAVGTGVVLDIDGEGDALRQRTEVLSSHQGVEPGKLWA